MPAVINIVKFAGFLAACYIVSAGYENLRTRRINKSASKTV